MGRSGTTGQFLIGRVDSTPEREWMNLWVTDDDGGNAHRLTNFHLPEDTWVKGAWSPDGVHIAIGQPYYDILHNATTLYITAPDAESPTLIVKDVEFPKVQGDPVVLVARWLHAGILYSGRCP